MLAHEVLIKALVSEKSMKESERGMFAFLVHPDANKRQIRHALKVLFQVDAVQILTQNVKGRTKRTGARRTIIAQSTFKKATVTLKKGQTLGGTEEKEKEKKGKAAKG